MDEDRWLQRLIASALCMGIGKRELMEDYYMDEIGDILGQWNRLHNPDGEETMEVDAQEFLGEGGEWLE